MVKAREMVEDVEALRHNINPIKEQRQHLLNLLDEVRNHYNQVTCFIVIIQIC